jgi:hypothetical protein
MNRFETIFENHQEWDPDQSLGSESKFGQEYIPYKMRIRNKHGDILDREMVQDGLFHQ